jgi:hypothetical protein
MKNWSSTIRILLVITACLSCAQVVSAGSWQGIEPFKSRPADVIQILGKPVSENPGGPLTFKVNGGTVSVSFVDENFVRTKKLRGEVAGTVLQIILQHENSSDTPESMDLPRNKAFTREETKNALIFRDLKEGIVYTFINGKLKTTRYTFSDNQMSRARR